MNLESSQGIIAPHEGATVALFVVPGRPSDKKRAAHLVGATIHLRACHTAL